MTMTAVGGWVWLISAALAQEPADLRWLEDPVAPEVIEWRDARTADALAWVGEDGTLEELVPLVAAWSKTLRNNDALLDAAGGRLLLRRSVAHPDNQTEPDWRLWKRLSTLRVDDWEVPLDNTEVERWWPVCQAALSPDGSWLVWGHRLPEDDPTEPSKKGQPCRMYLTPIGSAEHRPLGDLELSRAGFTRDNTALVLTLRDGSRTRIERHALDSDEVTVVLDRRGRWLRTTIDEERSLLWQGVGRKRKRRWRPHTLTNGGVTHRLGLPRKWFSWVGLHDGTLMLLTTVGADQYRVVGVDPQRPGRSRWSEVFSGTEEKRLVSAKWVGDRFAVVTLEDGSRRFTERDEAGEILSEPIGGPFSHVSITHSLREEALVRGMSPRGAEAWLRGADGDYRPVRMANYGVPTRFERVLATSADGTEVPVSVVFPADHVPTGEAPVWLQVYGGFGHAVGASTRSAKATLWLQMGGIVATVHARGGDERGDEWHEQARKENLSLTYDDVIAAGEWFVEHGHSAEGRIVVSGFSNGGLTAMATVHRRPDLFGAAMAGAGVHDLIRGPAMGRWWAAEYGRPSDPGQADVLRSISPVHATPERLPPIWLTTGQADPTVTPSHSYKLAAAWDDVPGGPVLLRVWPWTSHAAHLPKAKREAAMQETTLDDYDRVVAEEMAFLVRALGLDVSRLRAPPHEAPRTAAPSQGR